MEPLHQALHSARGLLVPLLCYPSPLLILSFCLSLSLKRNKKENRSPGELVKNMCYPLPPKIMLEIARSGSGLCRSHVSHVSLRNEPTSDYVRLATGVSSTFCFRYFFFPSFAFVPPWFMARDDDQQFKKNIYRHIISN